MDKKEFVEELKDLADRSGALVRLNLVNTKGSPMNNCRLEVMDPRLIESCQLTSALIIPKFDKEEVDAGRNRETTVPDNSGEV
jgi:hypothetical protein